MKETLSLLVMAAVFVPSRADDKLANAGRQFTKRCVSCHQPPDLDFTTDRAWLDQVNRTA